jgi:hypothetical protein
MNESSSLMYLAFNQTNNLTAESTEVPHPVSGFILRELAGLFSIISNCLTLIILAKIEHKSELFKQLIVIAVCELFYSVFSNFYLIFEYFISNKLFAKVIIIILDEFVTAVLTLIVILLNIYISIQRFLLLANIRILDNIKFHVSIIILICFSILFYVPLFFLYEVKTNKDISLNQLGQSVFPFLLKTIRNILWFLVLPITNSLMAAQLYRVMTRKLNFIQKESSN